LKNCASKINGCGTHCRNSSRCKRCGQPIRVPPSSRHLHPFPRSGTATCAHRVLQHCTQQVNFSANGLKWDAQHERDGNGRRKKFGKRSNVAPTDRHSSPKHYNTSRMRLRRRSRSDTAKLWSGTLSKIIPPRS
jgi:hypothetical protein